MAISVHGFPKSMNIGLAFDKKNGVESEVVKETQNKWQGWGTALKPSFEPIIVARKPFKGSLVDNVIEYGVGGINIDECRVGTKPRKTGTKPTSDLATGTGNTLMGSSKNRQAEYDKLDLGRFPANTILTYDETDFDEVCGGFPNTKCQYRNVKSTETLNKIGTVFKTSGYKERLGGGFNDSGSAARYFYCAKASKKDRDEGLDIFNQQKVNDGRQTPIDNPFQRGETPRRNVHPCVKPTTLMQYLVRLVTPKNGIILDPFMGSGSTGKAVMYENNERQANYSFIGIEKEKEYCDIAKARIEWAKNYKKDKTEDNQIHIDELGGLI